MAHALTASLAVVAEEPARRDQLHELSRHLRSTLLAAGLQIEPGTSHIVPIPIGSNDAALAVAAAMQAEGFDVRAIRPPTVPDGSARLRVSVNVGVNRSMLDQFARLLMFALKEAGVCSAASS
jgi:8-amino-7-oxononanoate synthase